MLQELGWRGRKEVEEREDRARYLDLIARLERLGFVNRLRLRPSAQVLEQDVQLLELTEHVW